MIQRFLRGFRDPIDRLPLYAGDTTAPFDSGVFQPGSLSICRQRLQG